jgi:isopentenyl-diphosphate delta-isomerase
VFENGLTENEIDHVYLGQFDGEFKVNPEEVANFRWIDIHELETQIEDNPGLFTVWFKEIMKYKGNFENEKILE